MLHVTQHECIFNRQISDPSTKFIRSDKHMRFGAHPIDTECIHVDP